jgi:Flp pilus assembly protein TadD
VEVMVSRVQLAVISLILPFISSANIFAQDINSLKQGVVRIQNNRSNEIGTGFIVKVDGTQIYIVTAAHVVKGDQHPTIYLYNQQRDSLQGEVLDREDDDTKGLALLRSKVPADVALKITALKLGSTKQFEGGEDIKVIGFPDGTSFWTVGSGSIARIEGRNLLFSGAIRGGNSGAPVISHGLVIGIVTDVGQSSAYATRGEAIEPYINGIVSNLISLSMPNSKQAADVTGEERAEEARQLNKTGKYEDAIKAATEAIKLDRGLASAYAQRAYAYINTRKFKSAISDASEAIRLEPELAIAYAYRGAAYNRVDLHDQAIADCTKAISLDPGLAVAYANRGASYLIQHNFEQAIKDCTEAIQLNPRYRSAYTNRGHAHLRKGDFEKAIESYSEAIELEPNNPSLYEDRADAYKQQNKTDLMRSDRKKAEELKRKQ